MVGIEEPGRLDPLLEPVQTIIRASKERLLPLRLQDISLAGVGPLGDVPQRPEPLVGEVEAQIRDGGQRQLAAPGERRDETSC